MNSIYNRSFQAAERKIIRRICDFGMRERKRVCIAEWANFIYTDAARIFKTHCAARLIKRLARGVITRLPIIL